MFEIRERTTVTEPDGTQKVLLPGRITDTEAELYGLTAAEVPAPVEPAPKKAKK